MQAVAIVDCRGGSVVAVQEGPGLAISSAAAAARRVGALLRQSTADPSQQRIDTITGDRTAPVSAGQLEFQSRGAWSASYRRCGDVYVAALYKSWHGMTAAEAAALSSKTSKFLWTVSPERPPRASAISRMGPGLYSGLRRILNGQDWQVASGGNLLSPLESVPPTVFLEAIAPGDCGNVSQWKRQRESHNQLESLQKQIENSVGRADLLPLAIATGATASAASTSAVNVGDFFSSASSSATATGGGEESKAAAQPDPFGALEAIPSSQDPSNQSAETSFFGDSAFQKDDGGDKEQSLFADSAFTAGATAAAAAAAPIESSSDFGFGDSAFGSETGDIGGPKDDPAPSSSDNNTTQFENSFFGNESAAFQEDSGSAPSTTQQEEPPKFEESFFDSTKPSQGFGFDDAGFGHPESSDVQAPEAAAPFASFDSGPHSATNGDSGFGNDAFQSDAAFAPTGGEAFAVLPLAKKSKTKLLAKLEETAFAEFSNGQLKKSSIQANVSVIAKKNEQDQDLDDSSNQFVEAEDDQDLLLTLHLPHSGISSQGIRAAKNGISVKKRSSSQVSICISKGTLETATSTGQPLSVLKYGLASPFLFLPVAIECLAKFDDFKANVDIIARCSINPEFKGAIDSMTVSLSIGSWLAPLKIKPRARFSSTHREVSWNVENLSPGSAQDLRCRLSVLASAPNDLADALSGAVRAKIKDIKSHVTYSVLQYDNFEQSGVSQFSASPNNYSSTVVVMS